MLRVRRRPAVAVVLLAGFFFGCHGQDSKQEQGDTKDGGASGAGSSIESCVLLSEDEIASIVGNAVSKGRPFADVEVCKWDTEDPANVDVLLTVRAAGSVRAQTLCSDVKTAASNTQQIAGLGDIAVWKFSSEGSLLNSGDLEVCGPIGYISFTLQGKRGEPALKAAAVSLAKRVIQRL